MTPDEIAAINAEQARLYWDEIARIKRGERTSAPVPQPMSAPELDASLWYVVRRACVGRQSRVSFRAHSVAACVRWATTGHGNRQRGRVWIEREDQPARIVRSRRDHAYARQQSADQWAVA